MPTKAEFIFFDIGDVLFDEDAPHTLYYHSLFRAMRRNGVAVGWDEFYARIRQRLRINAEKAVPDAVASFIPDAALFEKVHHEGRGEYDRIREPRPYGVLLSDVTPVLQELKRDFRLGIIANQHPPIVEALTEYGIAPLFDVVAIDQVLGISKPDPRIFQWAMSQAGLEPAQCVMVGDRPDNDIAPARRLGMRTVRFRRGIHYSLCDPRGPEEQADVEVREVQRLAASVRTAAQGAV